MAMIPFAGVKVFSTTLARDREMMGETITKWIKDNPNVEIVDKVEIGRAHV
jgi:folate-dependent tRNA-U54 methylase TrmFO/GidA